TVRSHKILQGERAELFVFRVGRRRQPLCAALIIVDGLVQKRVILGVALLARLVQIVVAVAEEEVGGAKTRIGRDGLLGEGGGLLVILRLVGLVGRLERLFRLDLADFGAADRRKRTQGQHRDERRRCPRQRTHSVPPYLHEKIAAAETGPV